MPILEDLKEYTERATGLKRPGEQEAPESHAAQKAPRGPLQGRRSRPQSSAMAADHLSGDGRSR